jgi:hypothetical protein
VNSSSFALNPKPMVARASKADAQRKRDYRRRKSPSAPDPPTI